MSQKSEQRLSHDGPFTPWSDFAVTWHGPARREVAHSDVATVCAFVSICLYSYIFRILLPFDSTSRFLKSPFHMRSGHARLDGCAARGPAHRLVRTALEDRWDKSARRGSRLAHALFSSPCSDEASCFVSH